MPRLTKFDARPLVKALQCGFSLPWGSFPLIEGLLMDDPIFILLKHGPFQFGAWSHEH